MGDLVGYKEITNIELNIKSDNSQYDVYKLLSKELSKITKVDYDYIIIDLSLIHI